MEARLDQMLLQAAHQASPGRVHFAALEGLPPPVVHYFKRVLCDGQRFIRVGRLEQEGRLRTGTRSNRWLSFEARHVIVPSAPGFMWDARVSLLPLLHLRPGVRAAMTTPIWPSTKRVGLWSAVLCTVFSLTYIVGQLAEWLGWLGSQGGPESASTPLGLLVLLTPSLLLGPSFLVLVVSIHQLASPERKIWSHAAVAFATAYTVLISVVYFVQLTWVAPRLARGQTRGIEAFLFVPFDSFLYTVDILGYSFMSLATLFAARVFTGDGLERVVRLFLTANGLLLPFLALQMYVHSLIWIAALWAVTFPGSTWSLALLFRHRVSTR